MSTFNTHVYATVRVKVIGTNFNTNPKEVADAVASAVCADPTEWFTPVLGRIDVAGVGTFEVEHVEAADSVDSVLVDEVDQDTGLIIKEHLFDPSRCMSNALAEAIKVLADHPDASRGNSKVHYALMCLQGAQAT